MIKIPCTKQDSPFFAAIWVDLMHFETIFFIIRTLTTEPALVTAQTQLLTCRSSKIVTIILLLSQFTLKLLQSF